MISFLEVTLQLNQYYLHLLKQLITFKELNSFPADSFIYETPQLNADISYVVYYCCFMRYRLMKGQLFDED